MRSFISNFQTYLPPFEIKQEQTLKWLETLHQKRDPQKEDRVSLFIKKFGVSPDKIQTRRSFIEDFTSLSFEKNELFDREREFNPNLSERSQFAQNALEEATKSIYSTATDKPDHLLHVSCTHYESPSAAQKIVLEKEWDAVVTHMYHMGCYAALPAIRTASALSSQGQVDILHTEICSLHLNCDSYSPEQLVVQSLFADGAIKYSCFNDRDKIQGKAFEILSQHEILVPGTETDMTWKLHQDRFDMTLSKNVPKYLGDYLQKFMEKMFHKAGLEFSSERERALFAIHPGGPKIIELAGEILNLREEQIQYSKQILNSRGNMSSATLPHIWDQILSHENDRLVATVAFGPGLTMTGALLKIC